MKCQASNARPLLAQSAPIVRAEPMTPPIRSVRLAIREPDRASPAMSKAKPEYPVATR